VKAAYFHISSSVSAIIMKNPGFIIDPSSVQLPVPASGGRKSIYAEYFDASRLGAT